jgi:hypothetical protein
MDGITKNLFAGICLNKNEKMICVLCVVQIHQRTSDGGIETDTPPK